MELPQSGHEPVMMVEVLEGMMLEPGAEAAPAPAPGPGKEGRVVVDCTVGRAGHSRAMAERLGAEGTLIGLDVDPKNLEYAQGRLEGVGCRVRLFHANFAELTDVLEAAGVAQVDGILADLGVSTNQLFDSAYGMSFAQAMPLDMRLDPRLNRSAADYVNELPEKELADVLYNLAQEHYSRRIARKIADERRIAPIKTTERLAGAVRSAIGHRGGGPGKIDPATRTFLALRMLVNQELENLRSLLDTAPRVLSKGGRLAVISFQSMEDRLVKQAFRSAEQAGLLSIVTPRPLCPTDAETDRNPRSRSAKLRVAQRV